MAKTTSRRKTKSRKKKRAAATAAMGVRNKPLSKLTDEALRSYLNSLNGHKPSALYRLVMSEVEKPMFKAVLEYADGNQSQAAEILGINRGTLRKKLETYNLLPK